MTKLSMTAIRWNSFRCIRRWGNHDTHQMRAIEERVAAFLGFLGLHCRRMDIATKKLLQFIARRREAFDVITGIT